MENVDLVSTGFILLATLGIVNVITFFKKDLTSAQKWGLSVVVAFALSFVPADLGSELANKLVLALEIASAASGGYVLAKRAGGQ